MGKNDISDSFMRIVGEIIEEVFDKNADGIDAAKQEAVIRANYERNAAIPLFKNEFEIPDREMSDFEELERTLSICDIITEFSTSNEEYDRQMMEIVEHILHAVTMTGLHYTYYNEWGVNKQSQQYQYMTAAQSSGYYNVEGYVFDEGEQIPADIKTRISLQEYAYWVITTAWSVQEKYGEPCNKEWTNYKLDDLRENMAGQYEMFMNTVPNVMVAPSDSILESFG